MSSKPDPETWTHPALKTTTIKRLKPPGPGSNYNEWTWFMRAHLNTTDVMANPNWARDNKAAFGAISSTIHAVHVQKVRHITTDARALWTALKEAHQDSSAGGITYFLCKLTTAQMTGNDLLTHLEDMAKTFESLSALITANALLTLDNIYSSSILTSLPSDWLACVLAMMNNPRRLLIKLCPGTLDHRPITPSIAPSAKGPDTILRSSGNRYRQKPPAKAGQTTVVDLGNDKNGEDSDYSGSDVDKPAGNAVAVVGHAANTVAIPHKDANLDSGCSNCMTPYRADVKNIKPNATPIRLADNSAVKASHHGTVVLPLATNVSIPTLVVPDLHEPLLSIAAMCDAGLTCIFQKDGVIRPNEHPKWNLGPK
ncbi:hypothetical protein PTTG_28151 [Puccinia triticina 1-1 BBBD Race 1]|uniref:Retrovirus-related Pol polyprotein from transposon TNT 1-94-like beta-barrel domain-containing protein n=1 Tax=Puccinia triticina (isolate 1-1 / race 1 (BBBD)) TaxID=630390 RepID=A0A180GE12_PUCT1|nr:hypothetical protein PTTG_28151 [Puccinia triticina 1-1 BBBD Race 1]